jgi:hypothetical protein
LLSTLPDKTSHDIMVCIFKGVCTERYIGWSTSQGTHW